MAQFQGPRAQMERHFVGLYLYLAGRCCEKLQSTKGPSQCKSGSSNDMLASIGLTIYYIIFQ